jgi:hypothetical protein
MFSAASVPGATRPEYPVTRGIPRMEALRPAGDQLPGIDIGQIRPSPKRLLPNMDEVSWAARARSRLRGAGGPVQGRRPRWSPPPTHWPRHA